MRGYNPLLYSEGRAGKIFSYSKPRLNSLKTEQEKALELKNKLESHYGQGKIPVVRKHWPTIVNSYIYGNYPVEAIIKAIKLGGKTVHPAIPYESWSKSKDYKTWINK